jgi:hypothetical protein
MSETWAIAFPTTGQRLRANGAMAPRGLAERDAIVLSGPADKPWGMREMAVAEPAGHRMMFGQRLTWPVNATALQVWITTKIHPELTALR